MERGNPLKATPTCKEKGTPLNGVAYSRKIGARNEWSLIALLETRLQEQDHWRRRLDDDDLEGKDQARVPGKVLEGETIRNGLKATSTCLGEGDSLERSRLLSLYRAPGTNGS